MTMYILVSKNNKRYTDQTTYKSEAEQTKGTTIY